MAILTRNNIVTNGLVMYLDAANTKSYPGSGNTWFDMSGNGFSGTLVNGPTFNSSNGGSIVFDGSNDYTSVPYTTLLTPNVASIATWVSASWSSLSGQRCIVSKTQTGGYQLSVNEPTFYPSGIGIIYYLGGAYRSASISTSTVSTGWHYIVSTFDGRYIKLYLDGIERSSYDYGSQTTIIYNNNNHLLVGAEPGSGTGVDGAFFPGKIASTSVYNRGLTAQEVLQNYNATKVRFGLT